MATVTVNGVALHYELSGRADAPVVVFSNSLGTTLDMWSEVAPEVERSFRILRYDTRGHGSSGLGAAGATIDDLADDLIALASALGIDRFHMVGLSLGGMTGQNVAARYPARIKSLTLMATSAYMPPADAWDARARTVREQGTRAITDAVLTRWFTPVFASTHPVQFANVRDDFLGLDAEGYARACEVIRDMDLRPLLPKISARTLVIAGADDPATPLAHAHDLVARIPHSRLVVLHDAAHLLAVEQPAATISELIAFLVSAEAREPAPHTLRV